MLHIILIILKILGWVLLAVLGLLVLVLLLVLFVPLRYRIGLGCRETLSSLEAEARFHLLFYLVSGVVLYQDKKLIWNLRAAWIKLGNGREAESEDEENAQEAAEEKAVEPAQETVEEAMETVQEAAVQPVEEAVEAAQEAAAKPVEAAQEAAAKPVEKGPETAAETMPQSKEEAADEVLETGEAAQEDKKGTYGTEQKEKEHSGEEEDIKEEENSGEEQSLSDKIEGVFEKIKYTFSRICAKIKVLLEKAEMVKAFLEKEAHQSAFWKSAAELKKLLLRLKPRRLEGDVQFGFEDPSMTGRVLAGFSMLSPYLEEVSFYPDFENKVLDGELSVQGALRLWPMAVLAWNMVWNRDVRTTIFDLKKMIFK